MVTSSEPLYNRDYVLLNVVNFLFSLYSVIFIFLPAYMYHLGIREGAIGVLMATGTLVSVFLKPGLGMVVGRGARLAFLSIGAFLAAASTLPWLFVTIPGAHLFLIRVAQGASYSIFTAASYAYIAASAPPARRAEALGIFGLSFFLPVSVGGWIGEWVIGWAGYHGLFVAGIGVAFLSALFPLGMREPVAREYPSIASMKLFLSRTFLVPNAAGYLFGVAYGSIFTFFYALSVIGTRTLWRKMLDRLPREWVSLFALVLMAVGNLLIPVVPGEVGIILVGAAAGAGHGFLFPALSALVLDRAREDSGAMALAMFSAAFDMGLVTGAAAFGFVAERFGYDAMFVTAAALVGAGTAAFFVLDPAFRKAKRPEPAQ
jgi:MFS family permease